MRTSTEFDPRRVRIWYGSSGSGHRMAAKAIEEALRERLPHCEILLEDVYQWLPWYRRWLYTVGWRFAHTVFWDLYSWMWKRSVVQPQNVLRERALYQRRFPRIEKELIAQETDLIISTHPIGAELAVLAKNRGLISRVTSVVTDYHAHAFTHVAGVDAVCIPDAHIIRMVRSAEEEAQIVKEVVTGIPVRRAFAGVVASPQSSHRPIIVFSKGGDTFRRSTVRRIAHHFRTFPWTLRFVNVKGIDAPRVLAHTGKLVVEVYPYWKAFASLLSEAAVFVAKPGGLTIAETTALGVPLVAISPHPGQEENNIEFMRQQGFGLEATSLSEIEKAILRILGDNSFSSQSRKIGKPHAAEAIVDISLNLIPRKGKTPVYPEGEKTT